MMQASLHVGKPVGGKSIKTELAHFAEANFYRLAIENGDGDRIIIFGSTLEDLRPIFQIPATVEYSA